MDRLSILNTASVGFGGRQIPRGPSSYEFSGIDWGQDNAEFRRKPENRWMTPTLSAYSGTLSKGKRFARPSILSSRTWKALLKDAGFNGASTAGIAALSNSLDHQMTTILDALREVKSRHPTSKVFGTHEQMITDFLRTLRQKGVHNAGASFPQITQTPQIWAQVGAARRVGKPMSEKTKARLEAQHVLPSICTKAAGFLKRFQQYMGVRPQDNFPGERVWGRIDEAWNIFQAQVQNSLPLALTRLEDSGLIPAKWAKMLRRLPDMDLLYQFFRLMNSIAVDIRGSDEFSNTVWNAQNPMGLVYYTSGPYVWILKEPAAVFPDATHLTYLNSITKILSAKDVVFFTSTAQAGNVPPKWPEKISKVMDGNTRSAGRAKQSLTEYYATLRNILPNMKPPVNVSDWFLNTYINQIQQVQQAVMQQD